MSAKPTTGKRAQLDKNKTTLFAIISIAAIVTIGCLVIAKGFASQGGYYNKVIDKKAAAKEQLEDNIDAVTSLRQAYATFVAQNPNLLGGNTDGNDDRSGTNADLVLDALPNKEDFPALITSVEKLLAGYKINGIGSGSLGVVGGASSAAGTNELSFGAELETSYDGLRQLFATLNRSIRPIQVTTLEMRGTSDSLQASIGAKSFYQPETGLQITSSEVQ